MTVRRRSIYHTRDSHSAVLIAWRCVGEYWHMYWMRMFEQSRDGNHFGLAFAEMRSRPLRIGFFSGDTRAAANRRD